MRKTREDTEKTRLGVIAAALKLFSSNGYSRTTLNMIAAEAGFSRGPIYWHFRNKDELFEAVLHYSQQPLQHLIDQAQACPDPVTGITLFIDEWFRLLVEDRWYRQSFEILLNKTELTDSMAATIRRERQLTRNMVEMLSKRLTEAADAGQLTLTDPAEDVALLLYTTLMGITQSWLFSPRLFSLAHQAPFFRRRLLAMAGHGGP
jgi:AcrR family transcriptional regulator